MKANKKKVQKKIVVMKKKVIKLKSKGLKNKSKMDIKSVMKVKPMM